MSDGSAAHGTESPTTGALVSQLSDDVSRLVRDELRLAQVELGGKAKQAGLGVGILGAGGLIALYAVGALIATAILALSLVLDAWLAALIVSAALLAIAGIAALMGKKQVQQAAPPVPSDTIESVRRDVDAVRHHGESRPEAGQ